MAQEKEVNKRYYAQSEQQILKEFGTSEKGLSNAQAEAALKKYGPNALEQAKQFTAATEVSALTITKLDGTAKWGVVLAIANQFKIPVKFIGVGEKIDDLLIFDKKEFVDSLFKLES